MPTVTREAVTAFTAVVRAIYDDAYKTAMPVWDQIATEVQTDAEVNDMTFISELPVMHEFVDERVIKGLSLREFLIKTKKYESTLGIDADVLRLRSGGNFKLQIQGMAERAVEFLDKLVFDAVNANGITWDGTAFYTSGHGNLGSGALNALNLGAAWAALESQKDAYGEPLHVMPTHLIVPPALRVPAMVLLDSMYNADSGGSRGQMSANIFRGALKLVVSNRLATTTEWHLWDCSRSAKPFIVVKNYGPDFVSLDGAEDTEVFMRDRFLYGTLLRAAAAPGLFHLAYKSTGL